MTIHKLMSPLVIKRAPISVELNYPDRAVGYIGALIVRSGSDWNLGRIRSPDPKSTKGDYQIRTYLSWRLSGN